MILLREKFTLLTPYGYREVRDLTFIGLTFLKWHIPQVFVDGVPYLTPVPMKMPEDGPAKLAWSATSSANIHLELAKVLAFAHMNTNFEFHEQLYAYYLKLVQFGAKLSPDVIDSFFESPGSHSLYLLTQDVTKEEISEFPSLHINYMRQYDGHAMKVGFSALDYSGARLSNDEKITMFFPFER